MQLVQTVIRLPAPFTLARTGRRFTFQRRRVLLLAWETLLPNCGPLPHRSHLAAMVVLQSRTLFVEGSGWASYVRASVRARKGSHSRAHFCFTPALLRSYHGDALVIRKESNEPENSPISR